MELRHLAVLVQKHLQPYDKKAKTIAIITDGWLGCAIACAICGALIGAVIGCAIATMGAGFIECLAAVFGGNMFGGNVFGGNVLRECDCGTHSGAIKLPAFQHSRIFRSASRRGELAT